MTPEKLFSLNVGDVLQAKSLMPWISDEPVVCQITFLDRELFIAHVSCTYFGVNLGKLAGKIVDGRVKWAPVLGASTTPAITALPTHNGVLA